MSVSQLTVINNGRCGQNSGIVRDRFAADVLHLSTTPDYVFMYIGMNDAIAPELKGMETIVCVGDSLTYGFGNQGAGTAEGDTYPAMLRSVPLGRRKQNEIGG